MGTVKQRLCCRLPRWGATLVGAVAVALALSAGLLGIDKNTDWGPRRLTLLLFGVVALCIAQWALIERVADRLWRALSPKEPGSKPSSRGSLPWTHRAGVSETDRPGLADTGRLRASGALGRWQKASLLGVVLVIEIAYVWFVSAGFWTRWPTNTEYYDLLADGFLQWRTSLVIEPDPRLGQIENPYSYDSRDGIPYLADLSYFEGEYFLYWGPVPAALLVLPKLALGHPIADLYLVFAAVSAILGFSTLILLFMWVRFFADRLPFWLLLAGVGLAGFGFPLIWVLGGISVYEAAISCGMAFLLAGVYAALPTLVLEESSRARLSLAGLCLALSVGSRVVLGPAVFVLFGAAVVQRARRRTTPNALRLDVAGLLLPFAVGILLLGWYNYDRFGNPFETGYRFQLTDRSDDSWRDVFDVRYLVPNAYNYLLRPIRVLSIFPFIKPSGGVQAVPFLGVFYPTMYTTDYMTGTLVAVPAMLWAIFLGWWIPCGEVCHWSGMSGTPSARRLRGGLAALAGLVVVAFLSIGVYYWNENRFQMDYVPVAVILSAIGAWIAVDRHPYQGVPRFAIRAAVALTFLASMLMALLLGVSGGRLRFETVNPDLFEWITRLLA